MAERPLPFLHPACLLATWFGAGLLPKAPGTWGSLAALVCAWPLVQIGGRPYLLVGIAVVFALGLWAADHYARATNGGDPGEVVIDEVAGQWIALLPVAGTSLSPGDYALACLPALIAFRLFDIWKPWPVGWLDEKLHGGLGIMMDDVAAGLYAGVVVALIVFLYAAFAGGLVS